MYNKESNQYIGYIYLIENKVNRKQYIGQTFRSIDVRFKEHIRHSFTYKNNKRTRNTVLYKAMNKYGVKNFMCKEIFKCYADSVETLRVLLNKKEIELISKHNTIIPNGYNMTIGGNLDGCMGCNRKAVAQYDLSGNLIEVYYSISEARQKTNLSGLFSSINKGYLIGGYQWILVDNITNVKHKIKAYNGKNAKRVIQVDFDGNLINEYTSVAEASKTTGINNVVIGDCIDNRNGRKSAGGFQWFCIDFDEDVTKIKFPKYQINTKRNSKGIKFHPINMYTLNGEYIKTFQTTLNALTYIGKEKCYPSGITSCCSKTQKTAFGYKWFYSNDPDQPDKTKIISNEAVKETS